MLTDVVCEAPTGQWTPGPGSATNPGGCFSAVPAARGAAKGLLALLTHATVKGVVFGYQGLVSQLSEQIESFLSAWPSYMHCVTLCDRVECECWHAYFWPCLRMKGRAQASASSAFRIARGAKELADGVLKLCHGKEAFIIASYSERLCYTILLDVQALHAALPKAVSSGMRYHASYKVEAPGQFVLSGRWMWLVYTAPG